MLIQLIVGIANQFLTVGLYNTESHSSHLKIKSPSVAISLNRLVFIW